MRAVFMIDTAVSARVSPALKAAAMVNAKAPGLDLSTVIRMVVNRLAVNAELPKDLLQPNQKTLEAIRNLENGVDIFKGDL